jgi:hypothetical protein
MTAGWLRVRWHPAYHRYTQSHTRVRPVTDSACTRGLAYSHVSLHRIRWLGNCGRWKWLEAPGGAGTDRRAGASGASGTFLPWGRRASRHHLPPGRARPGRCCPHGGGRQCGARRRPAMWALRTTHRARAGCSQARQRDLGARELPGLTPGRDSGRQRAGQEDQLGLPRSPPPLASSVPSGVCW